MSRLTNVKKGSINREFGVQPYRSSKPYQEQARIGTEKAKDVLVSGANPESEMVQPYIADNYGEMEYYVEAPSGLASFIPFDWDGWAASYTTVHFDEYWSDEGFFFTSNGKALITINDKVFEQAT